MNKEKMNNDEQITSKEFAAGINLFIEILKTQPEYLKSATGPASKLNKGQQLAHSAAGFAVELHKLKHQYCGG